VHNQLTEISTSISKHQHPQGCTALLSKGCGLGVQFLSARPFKFSSCNVIRVRGKIRGGFTCEAVVSKGSSLMNMYHRQNSMKGQTRLKLL